MRSWASYRLDSCGRLVTRLADGKVGIRRVEEDRVGNAEICPLVPSSSLAHGALPSLAVGYDIRSGGVVVVTAVIDFGPGCQLED